MLKKERRIGRIQFNGLSRPYKSITGKFFVVRLFNLTSDTPSKFAVSISKKQEKKASARNRIRRAAYQAILPYLSHSKNGVAVHFILQKKPEELKRDITNDINHLLSNI